MKTLILTDELFWKYNELSVKRVGLWSDNVHLMKEVRIFIISILTALSVSISNPFEKKK